MKYFCENLSIKGTHQVLYYYKKLTFLKKYGYFRESSPKFFDQEFINADEVVESLSKIDKITVEITQKCNMSCKYCGFLSLYENIDKTRNSVFNEDYLFLLIDELMKYWNNEQRQITISFYGGEPLLEFNKIRKIISNLENKYPQLILKYQITTNGTLIKKHAHYLVKKNFFLAISLDGNKKHNSYRKLKNGKQSFDIVFENVKFLRNNYPNYFKHNVHFSTVLHNLNNITETQKFFKEEFGNYNYIGSLKTNNINPQKINEFKRIYQPKNRIIKLNRNDKKYSYHVPSDVEIETFLRIILKLYTKNLFRLINGDKRPKTPALKTCIPFSIKLFLSADGYIFPCESITKNFPLGCIQDNRITLEPVQIARIYNELMKINYLQCKKCKISEFCFQCLFDVIKYTEDKLTYSCFYDEVKFNDYIVNFINHFENDNADFSRFILNNL